MFLTQNEKISLKQPDKGQRTSPVTPISKRNLCLLLGAALITLTLSRKIQKEEEVKKVPLAPIGIRASENPRKYTPKGFEPERTFYVVELNPDNRYRIICPKSHTYS